MKKNRPRSSHKMRHRLVAIIICAVLVIVSVVVGVISITSYSFAEDSTTAEEPAGSAETDSGGGGDTDTGDGGEGSDSAIEGESDEAPEVTVEITKYPRSMSVGAKSTLSLRVENAKQSDVAWKSNKKKVATVDPDGTVRAIAEGNVKITASVGKVKSSVTISVTEELIKLTSFVVDVTEFTADEMLVGKHGVRVGDELHMTARAEPAGARIDGEFVWDIETSDSSIVTLSAEGDNKETAVLTANDIGDFMLTVRYVDENVELNNIVMDFNITKEGAGYNDILLAMVIAIVAIIVIILITLAVRRRKRRIIDGRRERAAQRKRAAAGRGGADGARRKPAGNEGYARGMGDGGSGRVGHAYDEGVGERYGRDTRVYDTPPVNARERRQPRTSEKGAPAKRGQRPAKSPAQRGARSPERGSSRPQGQRPARQGGQRSSGTRERTSAYTQGQRPVMPGEQMPAETRDRMTHTREQQAVRPPGGQRPIAPHERRPIAPPLGDLHGNGDKKENTEKPFSLSDIE